MGLILGVVKHARLMELKNSGVVDALGYDAICRMYFFNNKRFKENKFMGLSLISKFRIMLNNKFFTSYNYFMANLSSKTKRYDPDLMFLNDYDLEQLDLARKAKKNSEIAAKGLEAFRFFDEIFVDSHTAYAIEWLLHNKHKLKVLLNKEG